MQIQNRHPHQPLYKTEDSVHRFKPNTIVQYLLDNGGIDLNQLAVMGFEQNEWSQFAQLIGYSFCGWSTLSYVTDEEYEEAVTMNLALCEYVSNYQI